MSKFLQKYTALLNYHLTQKLASNFDKMTNILEIIRLIFIEVLAIIVNWYSKTALSNIVYLITVNLY